MMTITIELRVAYESAEKNAVMLKIVRALAKQLLTQASLMQDKMPPHIKVSAGDFYTATEELLLFDEDGTELDTEVTDVVERFTNTLDRGQLNQVVLNARPKEDDDDPDYDDDGNLRAGEHYRK